MTLIVINRRNVLATSNNLYILPEWFMYIYTPVSNADVTPHTQFILPPTKMTQCYWIERFT